MQEIPYLAKFKDGWPVECILIQYLKNHVRYKRQRDHELADPKSVDEVNEMDVEDGVQVWNFIFLAHIFYSAPVQEPGTWTQKRGS